MTFRTLSIERFNICRLLPVIASLTLVGCTSDEPIAADTCGNKVLEPQAGEDCDGEANCRSPEEENGCRYRCVLGQSECPSGFGCGTDGVCRRAAGSYSVVELEVTTPTVGLAVADMDGDKRQDVVRTSVDKTFVQFFDSGVVTAKVDSLLKPPTLPILGDLTGDGRADMGFIEDVGIKFGSGLAVFRSQSDRTFKGTTYSSLPLQGKDLRGVAVTAVSPFFDNEAVVMVDRDIVGFSTDGALAPLWIGASFHVTELTGMLAGNFDEGMAVGPCDEVAYALGGDTQVGLFHTCVGAGGQYRWDENPMGSPQVRYVSLPSGATVWDFPDFDGDGYDGIALENQSLLKADFNNDGHLDLAIVALDDRGPENPSVYVSFGLGDGTFHSAGSPPLPMTGDNAAARIDVPVPQNDEDCDGVLDVPLAFADLNGDGFQDVISEEWVMLTKQAPDDFRATQCQTDWKRAVVGDLNGDGILDFAAARSEDPGIEFFSGAGDGTFAKSVVPTKQTASLLDVGDFDGDLISDLVYVELGDTTADWEEFQDPTTLDAHVYVAYGNAAGAPDIPVLVGELEFVEGLVSGRFEGGDSTSDVVVASRPLDLSEDHKLGLAFIGGDASRQLHAPYLFAVEKKWEPSTAGGALRTEVAWASYGRFNDDELGMAVFTEDEGPPMSVPSYRPWRISSDERGKFSITENAAVAQKLRSGLDCSDCLVAAVDLDSDGLDELVTFQDQLINIYDSSGGVIEWREAIDTEYGFVTIDQDEFFDAPTVRDVDGDGHQEVALILDGGDALVIWGDGSGDLAVASATTVKQSSFGPLSDLAFLNADADPELEMVVVGEYLLPQITQLDVAARTFESLETATELIPLQEDFLVFGDVVTAADFDGDGVDDIALGDYGEYTVLRGERVRP